MVKVRCTVYDSGGEELFREEGVDKGIVAFNASERARAEYPLLIDVEWRFERVYPDPVPHEPLYDLSSWEEHIAAWNRLDAVLEG